MDARAWTRGTPNEEGQPARGSEEERCQTVYDFQVTT